MGVTPPPPKNRGKAWWDDTAQLGPDKHARDVPALDRYAEERWEVGGSPILEGGVPKNSAAPPLKSAPEPPFF